MTDESLIGEDFEEARKLIASVEELRALPRPCPRTTAAGCSISLGA